MNEDEVKTLCSRGEGISIEFKEVRRSVNKKVYQTICAFPTGAISCP